MLKAEAFWFTVEMQATHWPRGEESVTPFIPQPKSMYLLTICKVVQHPHKS